MNYFMVFIESFYEWLKFGSDGADSIDLFQKQLK